MRNLIFIPFAIVVSNLMGQTQLNITGPGQFCGNYVTSASQPAIQVTQSFSGEVIIKNSLIIGSGGTADNIIECSQPGVKITIINCSIVGNGLITKVGGFAKQHALYIAAPQKLYFINNHVISTAGVTIVGEDRNNKDDNISTAILNYINNSDIKILYNKIYNTDGRAVQSTSSGNKIVQNGGSSSIAFWWMPAMPKTEIAWNEIINEPDKSSAGDVIGIIFSGGK